MNIYVGNLSFQSSEDEIKQAFEAYGEVKSVAIIKDRMTGESRGFAFVEMANSDEGQNAINALNGKDLKGRKLTVNEARPRDEAPRGGGGGFGGGQRRPMGGGGGGYGGNRGGDDRGGRRSW